MIKISSFFNLILVTCLLIAGTQSNANIFQDDPTYNILPPGTAILEAITQGSDSSTILGKSISSVFSDSFSNENNEVIIPTELAHANWNRTSNEYENAFAFTALLNDRSPFSWGKTGSIHLDHNPLAGKPGEAPVITIWDPICTPTLPENRSILSITSSSGDFAAVLDDGSVLLWGNGYTPIGQIGVPPPGQTIFSCLSGSIIWAYLFHDDTSELSIKAPLVITTSDNSIASILYDGSILVDGVQHLNYLQGTINSLVLPPDKKALSIASNKYAFAAIMDDGSVICWGNSICGGISPILPSGKKAVSITSTTRAFVAILDDRSLFCWGDNSVGGTTPILSSDQRVVSITANACAFTALLSDGAILCWGNTRWGGMTPTLPSDQKVVSIVSTQYAFTALLDDGSVISWGSSLTGGVTPTLPWGQKVLLLATPFEKYVTFQCDDKLPDVAIILNPSQKQGKWQYTENESESWNDIPYIPYQSDTEAFTLCSDAKIRFVPAEGFSGVPDGLTIRLINASRTVSNGERISVLPNGGLTPFSQGTVLINTVIQ